MYITLIMFHSNDLFSISHHLLTTGCIRGLSEEGMPKFRQPELKGNLYFEFDVIFPDSNFADDDKLKVQPSHPSSCWPSSLVLYISSQSTTTVFPQ